MTGDCYFYLTHRPLHTKWLFKYHKAHHTGIIHVAKSLDADALEHVFGNIGSFVSGILILWYFGHIINFYTICIWVGISTLSVCSSHSNLKCHFDDGVHQKHHKYIKYNYGNGFYICDRLMGTYKKL
jgi:lathosterol oxidase